MEAARPVRQDFEHCEWEADYQMIAWLQAHDSLSGWAQFFGAMLALFVTYLTAFAPTWRRKRQLKAAGERLLQHGFEAIESYHRVSKFFDPFPLSIRQASLSMATVAHEMSRFPVFKFDNQGSNSIARRLVAMGLTMSSIKLFLDDIASELDHRPTTPGDQDAIRSFLADRLEMAGKLVRGEALVRPDPPFGRWPDQVP